MVSRGCRDRLLETSRGRSRGILGPKHSTLADKLLDHILVFAPDRDRQGRDSSPVDSVQAVAFVQQRLDSIGGLPLRSVVERGILRVVLG